MRLTYQNAQAQADPSPRLGGRGRETGRKGRQLPPASYKRSPGHASGRETRSIVYSRHGDVKDQTLAAGSGERWPVGELSRSFSFAVCPAAVELNSMARDESTHTLPTIGGTRWTLVETAACRRTVGIMVGEVKEGGR